MKYIIGADIGTSGTKAVLFSEKGEPLYSAYREYELLQPHNGWAEQRPEDWKKAVFETLKELSAKVNADDIKGIGMSGQMHGLVLLGKDNAPLCDSIIWCDQRTGKEVEEICRVIGRENYIDLTCNAPNTGFTLSKLLWVKNNRPDIFGKINKILLPKDYINYCLTSNFITDVSDASGTGYFSVKERKWCREILDTFGIKEEWLPEVQESCFTAGGITAAAAEQCGLNVGTAVACGAGDQAAAALGNNIVKSGDVSISLGTSGVVFSATDSSVSDKLGRTHTFCHSVPGMWHVMGVTQACGLSVSWFRQNFARDMTYKQLDDMAAEVSSDGIIYLPYLMGERTPHMDPDCRGVFAGLAARHGTANLFRALIEGVCFSLRDCDELLKMLKIKAKGTYVCGGGAKSALWTGILADVLGRELFILDNPESGAKGVAILAAVAGGIYGDVLSACAAMNVLNGKKQAWSSSSYSEYDKIYPVYKKLYGAVKGAY